MSHLKIKSEVTSIDHMTFIFEGPIDENLELTIDLSWSQAIFDFNAIDQINSMGILKFIQFLNSLRPEQGISFVNVPSFVVNVMSLTKGIISRRFHVTSFFIPFYSAEIDKQEFKLYESSKLERPFVGSYRDLEGRLFELDTNLERYLNFLNLQK
jgi:hypothetical protein